MDWKFASAYLLFFMGSQQQHHTLSLGLDTYSLLIRHRIRLTLLRIPSYVCYKQYLFHRMCIYLYVPCIFQASDTAAITTGRRHLCSSVSASESSTSRKTKRQFSIQSYYDTLIKSGGPIESVEEIRKT